MFVDLSAGAELVEGALGHPWKDVFFSFFSSFFLTPTLGRCRSSGPADPPGLSQQRRLPGQTLNE